MVFIVISVYFLGSICKKNRVGAIREQSNLLSSGDKSTDTVVVRIQEQYRETKSSVDKKVTLKHWI